MDKEKMAEALNGIVRANLQTHEMLARSAREAGVELHAMDMAREESERLETLFREALRDGDEERIATALDGVIGSISRNYEMLVKLTEEAGIKFRYLDMKRVRLSYNMLRHHLMEALPDVEYRHRPRRFPETPIADMFRRIREAAMTAVFIAIALFIELRSSLKKNSTGNKRGKQR